MTTATTPDFEAIKAKQNAAWADGDYGVIGRTLQIVGESLAERMNLHPDASVLDIAAGNGNATLAFARRWHPVTSTDYVQGLLDESKKRAEAEGYDIDYRVADVEALPFDDGSYDAVVSTFGVMFSPNQEQAAKEMLRVCKPGGTIGMANWTPTSFIAGIFKAVGKQVPPPPGVNPPSRWGEANWLNEAFADAQSVEVKPLDFNFRYRSPAHFIEVFKTYYGPTKKLSDALDAEYWSAFEQDLLALISEQNAASDGSMNVPAQYLEVVITR